MAIFATESTFHLENWKTDDRLGTHVLSFLANVLSHFLTNVWFALLSCPLSQMSSSVSAGVRWGAGVQTQKNVGGVFGGWGRVPFNEPYAPLLSTIYDGA